MAWAAFFVLSREPPFATANPSDECRAPRRPRKLLGLTPWSRVSTTLRALTARSSRPWSDEFSGWRCAALQSLLGPICRVQQSALRGDLSVQMCAGSGSGQTPGASRSCRARVFVSQVSRHVENGRRMSSGSEEYFSKIDMGCTVVLVLFSVSLKSHALA